MQNRTVFKVLRWLVIILIPFLLTLVTVRLLITWESPSYPEFEYDRISSDRYGFTDEQRLAFAEATLNYLRYPESADDAIYLLEELRLPGSDDPLYNAREIEHMIDVKRLVDLFEILMWVFLIIVVGDLVFLYAIPSSRREANKAIMQGGLLTVGILFGMLILILIAWNFVFTQFHEILFPPDSWTFYLTDSLIRLFPEQFWFDFGIIWTGLIFIEGFILAIFGYLLIRKNG